MSPPRNARSAWSAALRLAALLVTSSLATTRCASGACELNSDCSVGTYCGPDQHCRYDCFEDRDCADGSFCNRDRGRCQLIDPDAGVVDDAGKKKPDAGEAPDVPMTVDAGPPPVDVPVVMDMGPPPVDVPVVMDMGPPPVDVPVVMDMGFPPVDLGVPDTGPPPVDVPPPVDNAPPRGGYLDPCATDLDCASGECLTTTSGARFCTRRCAATSECGDGFLCDSPPAGRPARCVLDDTGVACNARTAVPCARFCVGNPVDGMHAHCTHECRTATDCPAGYGCQDAGGGQRVCIAAEEPCGRDTDCTTNVCVGMAGGYQGCTSRCTSASDCPRRMTINVTGFGRFSLPPYECQVVGSERVCVPPIQALGGDIAGSRTLGDTCGPGSGDPLCRSGVCDSETNTCVQGCTPTGGCPSGFVCREWLDDGDVYLVCRRSVTGAVAVNGTCSVGPDCVTGLCLGAPGGSAYCTRFCNDRLCPTGMHCTPLGTSYDGTPIALCQR